MEGVEGEGGGEDEGEEEGGGEPIYDRGGGGEVGCGGIRNGGE